MAGDGCGTCGFWERDRRSEVGRCHRFPPFAPCYDDRGLADTCAGTQTLEFVETFHDDWCGEWCRDEG